MKDKFQINILENPEPMALSYVGDHVCFRDSLSLYEIMGDLQVMPLHTMIGESVFALSEEGLWTWDPYTEDDGRKGTFTDIFNLGKSFPDFSGIDGGGLVQAGYYVTDDYESRGANCLTSVELSTNKIYRYKGKEFSPKSFAFSEDVFARGPERPTDNLYCFDKYMKKKWRIKLPEEANKGSFGDMLKYFQPIITGGNVLINTGMLDVADQKVGKVYAFAVQNGSLTWQYALRTLPFSFYAVNDKYYLSLAGDIVILDTRSGEILLDAPSGFQDRVLVYPFMNNLLCLSRDEGKLRIFDNEAKTIIQDLEIPGGYSSSRVHEVISDGSRLYITGSRARPDVISTSRAIIVVSPYVGEGPVASIEPRVNMNVTDIVEKGEKIYQITTSHDILAEVLRFGEIWIRETVYKYGYERTVRRDHQDKEHKGRIVFKADPSKLPPDGMKQIKAMAKRLEETFDKLAVYPGAGDKYKFKIEVREK